jgi:pilus assembly protein CpaB
MNNTVLRILSAILAIGALAVGLLAIKLSQGPSVPASAPVSAQAPSLPMVPVAVSVKSVKAGQIILATDIAVKGLQAPPADAFKDMPEIVGRMAAVDIPAGTPLVPAQFAADSIAYLLKSGERAVGIQVDEVSSVGGFLKPGEHVDVLAYVPPSEERNNRMGTATVVIQDARLLTIGNVSKLEQDASKSKSNTVNATLTKEAGLKVMAEVQELRQNLKSAVLAVREADVNRLMTAATVGQLKLALRPPPMFDANAQLGKSQDKPNAPPPPSTTMDMTIRRTPSIVIQEGSGEREQGTSDNKNSLF